MAYYQWARAKSYADILSHVPAKKIKSLYTPYHEMDIRQFVDKMDEFYQASKRDTNLKLRRLEAGYTQSELAEITGIPLPKLFNYKFFAYR